MARYIRDFQTTASPQTLHAAVSQYLTAEGYEYLTFDGENVFQKGQGFLASPTFFKFSYFGNSVRMETWMKYAMLPGVFLGELGTDGFVGCAAKGPWKKRIKNVEGILSNFAMQSANCPPMAVQNTFDNNETELLNENDCFEETCILNETNAGPVIAQAPVFCNCCGNQFPVGTQFCSVCGQENTAVNNTAANNSFAPPPLQTEIPAPTYGESVNINYPPTEYNITRKEFIEKYAQPSLRKNITGIAILCYVCAGLSFIVSCLMNPIGIIDALVLAGFALGMHLAKSRVCAILILVLSIVEVVLSIMYGAVPIWWLVAGISAVITFNKIEKQYKTFVANGNRF